MPVARLLERFWSLKLFARISFSIYNYTSIILETVITNMILQTVITNMILETVITNMILETVITNMILQTVITAPRTNQSEKHSVSSIWNQTSVGLLFNNHLLYGFVYLIFIFIRNAYAKKSINRKV